MYTNASLILVLVIFLEHSDGINVQDNTYKEFDDNNQDSKANIDTTNANMKTADNKLVTKISNDLEEIYNDNEIYLYERNVEFEDDKERLKRTTKDNKTAGDEDCVGSKEYCNMTREQYVAMLNDYIYPQTYEWVLIGTHTAVFVVGLVGNALVCIAVYRNHTMRTVTNYFIVNLAMADFMVILFCLPPTVLWDVTETWFLGNVLCKLLLYFQVSKVLFI